MPAEHIITRIKEIESRIGEIERLTSSHKPKPNKTLNTSESKVNQENFSEILKEVLKSKQIDPIRIDQTYSDLDPLVEEYQNTGYMPNTIPKPLLKNIVKSSNPGTWDHTVENISKQLDLDPNLIHAIIQTESNYNPKAISSAGAHGLMQLMPETANQLGVQNILDPYENILGGATHIKQLLLKYKGDLIKSIAAYNAGSDPVDRANGIPSFTETRSYVPKVLNHYYTLRHSK